MSRHLLEGAKRIPQMTSVRLAGAPLLFRAPVKLTEEMRNAYRIFIKISYRKRPFGNLSIDGRIL
jgi:hypothetical protein